MNINAYDALKSFTAKGTTSFQLQLTKTKTDARPESQPDKSDTKEYLQNKYPNLTFQTYDTSASDWNKDSNFPVDELFTGKTASLNSYETPATKDEAVQRMLSIPHNSYAVYIHPFVASRMEEDPEYAAEITKKIEAQFDMRIAEFKDKENEQPPLYGLSQSQAISIGEDGGVDMWAGVTIGCRTADGEADLMDFAETEGADVSKMSVSNTTLTIEITHSESRDGGQTTTVKLSVTKTHMQLQQAQVKQNSGQQLVTTFKGDVFDLETGLIVDRKG